MTLSDLGPLDWRIAITDKNGRPTPEFQRRWNTQRDNNTKVPTNFVQLGDVPNSYTGDGLDVVRVKSTANGLEFVTLSAAMDAVGSTQGSIIYRNATGWTVLLPGTAGQALITGGSGANPSWGNGIPAGVQGDVLYYNGTAWVTLHAGTSGQVLTTGGTGANPSWQTPSGGGGGGSGSLPTLRGYGHVCNSASSFTLALPAGTAANDVAIVFGESGWSISPAAGFTQIYYDSAGTTSVGAWWKTVTSGDVTAGSYTFTTGGSFDAAFSIAVVQGPITATPNPKSYVAYHNPSGGDASRTLVTAGSTYATDLLIGWTGSRQNATLSQSGLTTKETYTDGSAACGILATGAGTTGGSTVSFNGMSGAGGYGSIVVVINGGGSPTPFGGGTAGQVWTSNGGSTPNWANATGGGGGGGTATGGNMAPQGAVTRPYLANFAWVNQSTATASDGSGGLVMINTTSSGSTENVNMLTQPVPGSTPFDVVAHINHMSVSSAYIDQGIHLYNSGSGKLISLKIQARGSDQMAIEWDRYNSTSSWNAAIFGPQFYSNRPMWLRMNVTSTTITAYISPNGLDWLTLGTENLSTFITSVDHCGININPRSNAAFAVFDSFAAGTSVLPVSTSGGTEYFNGQSLPIPTASSLLLTADAGFSGTAAINSASNGVSLQGTNSGFVFAYAEKTIPSGGTTGDFACTGLIRMGMVNNGNYAMGITLGDGSGKRLLLGFRNTQPWMSQNTGTNSAGTNVYSGGIETMAVPVTWRIRRTGSTIYFEISMDGINFDVITSQAATSFLASTLTTYGIGIMPNGCFNRLICHGLKGG